MQTHVPIEGLSGIPAGLDLAAALASVDRAALDRYALTLLAQARARLLAHVQAQLLLDVVEVGQSEVRPGSTRRGEGVSEFAADSVAFALSWPRRDAHAHLLLALDLRDRLPAVLTALGDGRIDLARARAFSDTTTGLTPADTDRVVGQLLMKAPSWTVTQLRRAARARVLRADPSLAKRRYQRSVANRYAYIGHYNDGTASLGGVALPPDRAMAAFDRVDRLARAARAGGDPRILAQLRADALLDLLEGRPFQLAPSVDPVTGLADQQAVPAPTDPDALPDPAAATATTPAAATTAVASGRTPVPVAGMCVCGGVQPAPRRGSIELVVGIDTLAGADDDPAYLAGFGPVLADIARQYARAQNTNPIWKFSLVDRAGNLLHHGHTQRRPTAAESAFVRARDRTCLAPGCTRPAVHCDLDHRRPWPEGGPSHRGNIDSLCRRHHRLRHLEGHALHPFRRGSKVWQTPDGHVYLVTPETIFPLDGAETGTDPDTGLPYIDLSPEPPPDAVVHRGSLRIGPETQDELDLKLARELYGRPPDNRTTEPTLIDL